MKCQNCQNECRSDALFCNICGSRLVKQEPVVATPAQPVFKAEPVFFADPPVQTAPKEATPVAQNTYESSSPITDSFLDEILAKTPPIIPVIEPVAEKPQFANTSAEAPVFKMPWEEEIKQPQAPVYTEAVSEAENTPSYNEGQEQTKQDSEHIMYSTLESSEPQFDSKNEPLSTGKFMLLEFMRKPQLVGGLIGLIIGLIVGGMFGYIGALVGALAGVLIGGLVRFILYLVWAFSGKTNKNLKNYSRSKLIWMLLDIAIMILISVLLSTVLSSASSEFMSFIQPYLPNF